jgi:hypothetical protein
VKKPRQSAHERLDGGRLPVLGISDRPVDPRPRAVHQVTDEQLLNVWRDAKQLQLKPTLKVTTTTASLGTSGTF